MPLPTLEFLLVCSDHQIWEILASAVRTFGGISESARDVNEAIDRISRRKIDGIIVDMALESAVNLIRSVREGKSNRSSVIFACTGQRDDAVSAIAAGATFVFHKPLIQDSLLQMLHTTATMMMLERRRYARHCLNIVTTISSAGIQNDATIVNLSETGMAIRSTRSFSAGAMISFSFALPSGWVIEGKGQVNWADKVGNAGIRFSFLTEAASRELPLWLAMQ